MANVAPYEIIAQPYTLYLAAVGTAFPAVDEEPNGSWIKVGTSGDLNYGEDGVTIEHAQKTEFFRSLGSTGVRKAFRTEEDLKISLQLVDLSLEAYAIALNQNTVTTDAAAPGVAGTKKIGLSRNADVATRALLVRGSHASAYGDWPAQYEVPVAVQIGEPKVAFVKGEPAALELEWMAMVDPNAESPDERFGRLVMQNAEAGT